MLRYDEALERILEAAAPLPHEWVPLERAHGRALADDVRADVDLPPFDNAMIDGFAVRAGDAAAGRWLPVSGEVAAGHEALRPLADGEAVRIFTGAPVPADADALVMVEDTEERDGQVRFTEDASPRYIRRRGSDITAGTLALARGAALTAGEIGLLASLNQTSVPCGHRPRVGLLTTGNELVPVGDAALRPGQIRDSNAPALCAAIDEAGAELVLRRHAIDTEEDITAAFDAFESTGCDVILSTGGVSVGAYDYVRTALERRGSLDFWRIAIKPGKPLAFGHIGSALFVGLPGNPVSSLVTFELFVRPLLRRLAGHAQVLRPQIAVTLAHPLNHEPGRREFARVTLDWNGSVCRATPTGAQGSHRTCSMVGADALVIAHEDHGDYPAGAVLPALLIR